MNAWAGFYAVMVMEDGGGTKSTNTNCCTYMLLAVVQAFCILRG